MGRKRAWKRKYIYLCIASLMIVFSGCVTLEEMGKKKLARDHLEQSQKFLSGRDYKEALKSSEKVLSLSKGKSPGDEALFTMGLVYAHQGNPEKDYKKAISFFERLTKDYPQSFLLEQAKMWVTMLQRIERLGMGKGVTRYHLEQSQKLLSRGDYQSAYETSEKILSLSKGKPPGDEALFTMGLIYAHQENPQKDYTKAIRFFERVTKEYPQSSLVEQAKMWVYLLQATERLGTWKAAIRNCLEQTQKLLSEGDYKRALEASERILSLSQGKPPGDEAIFAMGLIYVHYGNPEKDYNKAVSFFERMTREYPQSSLVEQAKMWVEVLQAIEKLREIDITIEQKGKEEIR